MVGDGEEEEVREDGSEDGREEEDRGHDEDDEEVGREEDLRDGCVGADGGALEVGVEEGRSTEVVEGKGRVGS